MVEVVPLSKQERAATLVQEIAQKGDDIPEKYIHKDGFPEAIDVPADMWRDNLVIDLSLLASSSATELAKLRSALSQWGCFHVINHGIESSFLEEVMEVSKQFFALSLDEKLKCSATDDIVQGYGNDSLYSGTQIPNWNDRLFLFLDTTRFGLECWPQKPKNFREMIEEYAKRISTLNKVLCKAMSRSLGLEKKCLEFGIDGPAIARFNLYPRCSCPDRVLGTKPHLDGSMITYLLPENVEGLQVLKDDQWYKVPVIPGALFINFGQLGEAITNGVFKSVMQG